MSSINFFFGGWTPIHRVVVVGIPMYLCLVLFLRLSGSRTIADMNVFDFIVTVAIGSAFGRALTARPVSLAEAVVAFLLLITLQYVVATLKTRSPLFARSVTNRPTLLYFRDEFLRGAMRKQRVTEEEVRGAARKEKVGTMDEVEAAVLESDGTVSVVTSLGDGSALDPVVREGEAEDAAERSSSGTPKPDSAEE
jgi:uncharacterized membrane protein YcaP (DUF421 family)